VFIITSESEVSMGYSILPEIKLLYRFKMEKRLLLFRATSTSHDYQMIHGSHDLLKILTWHY
jgi:hypothetical protein